MYVASPHSPSLAIVAGLVVGLAGSAAASPTASIAFERHAASLRGDAVAAVAFDRVGRRLAVGDASGALLGRPGQPLRRVVGRGPVHALAFTPQALDAQRALLVATGSGLYRVDDEGRSVLLGPGAGELARRSLRLAVAPQALAVATGAGVFVSPDARGWQRLTALPSGVATAVALRPAAGGLACWSIVGGQPWRLLLRSEGGRMRTLEAARVRAPLLDAEGAKDLRLDLPGVDVAILYPRAIALRRHADAEWEVLRLTLPPGARALRLVAALDRLWLATDRGLLVSPTLAGPWRRASPPAGSTAVGDLVGDEATLYAATARGLFVGSPVVATAAAGSRLPRTPEPSPDPDVRHVHLAALAYLSLQPQRVAMLRRGVRRRGWLPVVRFEIGRQNDESRRTDFDQSFVSGETRHLTDIDQDRSSELALGLTMSWDLGDTAYHPESLDVSKEARAVIELRDNVLDEITQAYFERRRVLADWARLDDRSTPEAERLRLRAAELAAGLDAWTGGWFTRHTAPLPPN